jgi:hypothetical protein
VSRISLRPRCGPSGLRDCRVSAAGTRAQAFLEGGNERMFGSIRSVTGALVPVLDDLSTQTGRPG